MGVRSRPPSIVMIFGMTSKQLLRSFTNANHLLSTPRTNKGPFAQPFYFMRRQLDEEVSAKVREHFKKCYVRPATGPAVRLELKYKI
jgi:hypothetical protein